MSRIGTATIDLPSGVDVKDQGGTLQVKGPKGQLETPVPAGIEAVVESGTLSFKRSSDAPSDRSLHGLTRALAANAVHGVSEGFERELEIVGIGYRGQVQGKKAIFNLGYSHQVEFPFPDGVEIDVQDNTKIFVRGIDKQKVGQTAAELRSLRPPDAYKGKGIRYKGEHVRLKVGKAGVTAGG
jgi:large subunit ribosomal protein L6